jgi:integrase
MDMSFRPASATPISFTSSLPIRTFAEAAESYLAKNPGEKKYLDKILPLIGHVRLDEVVPYDLREMAMQLYPTQSNSTRNRCFMTPVRAVCYHAADRRWGPITKIRNFREERPKRKKAASPAWLHAFVRQCAKDNLPHIAALVLFMSQTGARVSEAIALRWKDVDLLNRTVLLVKTKTEMNSTRWLTDQLVSRLHQLSEGRKPTDRVFRLKCRHSVNERIGAVCRRAGITYKPSHTCGRHAFANNTLAMGMDIKSIMEAGGWRSAAVFLGTYANPRNAGRIVADRHNLYQFDNEL